MPRDDSKNNKALSFSKLMRENGVRIPPIQREYAQGRENAYAIRHGLVEALLKCVSGPVHLDFIYGVLDGNGMLVPLDGQQRLTSLYLVYWYFGAIAKEWKFEYSSRRMAMRFVTLLQEDACVDYLHKPLNQREKPSCWLKGFTGFVPAWESDSTVAGMLVMLDEIHAQAQKLDKCIPPDALDRITFLFHECDQAISSDETYLKINARGEALTEWENIKSILDSRANALVNNGLETDNPIVKAARKWKNCINGEWTSCLECFLPEPDNNSLPAYIAVSIAMLNAAFRNIIDLAAAATINASQIVDRTTKNIGENALRDDNFSLAILGERLGSASVKNIEDLTEFYAKAFLHHTAIYSDYRDNLVWPDEAFIVVSEIFSALVNECESRAVGFWPKDRSQNKYWDGKGNLKAFKTEFLFSSVFPTDASLDEEEKQGFKTFLESFCNTEYSGVDFTYPHALRMLSIARSNASSNGDFALSRCLNFLDADCFNVSARNFHELNEILSRFQKLLAAGNKETAFSVLPLNNWRLVKWRFEHIIKSEQCKSDLFFGKGNDVDVHQLSFWRIEQKLALMSGAVHFTYIAETKDFDESKAKFFLNNLMSDEKVAKDAGFLTLMEFMPESPYFMTLPTSSKKDNEGYSQWRDFLLQPQAKSAFDNYFESTTNTILTCPKWVDRYHALVKKTGNAYQAICGRTDFHGGNRVFAYTSPAQITKDSKCLSYLDEEDRILDLVCNGAYFISWNREQFIRFACNKNFMISVDSIMGENNITLEIVICDDSGNVEGTYLNYLFSSSKKKTVKLQKIKQRIYRSGATIRNRYLRRRIAREWLLKVLSLHP